MALVEALVYRRVATCTVLSPLVLVSVVVGGCHPSGSPECPEPDARDCACLDASNTCDADSPADGDADQDTDVPFDADSEADIDMEADVEADADDDPVADTDLDIDTSTECGPVTTFSYTLAAPVALACDAGSARVVFDVTVPAHGQALARANLIIRHQGAGITPVIHFWNARVVVGTPELAYGIGDDVCPGVSVSRTNLGYGRLSAEADHVQVLSYQGSSPCTDGALTIEPGSTLDVWVESPEPECRERGIVVRSFYQMVDTDTNVYWVWPTLMAEVLSATFETTEASENARVLAVIEGTPWENPNSICGSEAATLVLQTALDGATLSTVRDVVPASSGMGHLVLAADAEVEVFAGAHEVSLLAGSNFDRYVTTGGCCGDATLAVIREP